MAKSAEVQGDFDEYRSFKVERIVGHGNSKKGPVYYITVSNRITGSVFRLNGMSRSELDKLYECIAELDNQAGK
ncbi:hypothetical protein [Chryseobacterium vrystaatense]|uniref:Uncharacterized protein n=1 Tax=Chryseobacterium vrystaatense TaxID=307480 RepID=A0ABR4UP73_9FLAO|nr:hypothetical protein [Chryseobacterium vrystaatense]KFF26873.1 hypothetical protein IW16_06230 [Chryseobacterium vrystaatense]